MRSSKHPLLTGQGDTSKQAAQKRRLHKGEIMSDSKRNLIEEELNSPEISSDDEILGSSLEDELWRDLALEDMPSGAGSGVPSVSPRLGSPSSPGRKKKGGKSKFILKRRDIIIIIIALFVVTGIVLGVVLPGVLEGRVSNYVEAQIVEGTLNVTINTSGALEFYQTRPITAAFAPLVLDFGPRNDGSYKYNYIVLSVNDDILGHDTLLFSLMKTQPDTKIVELLRVGSGANPLLEIGPDSYISLTAGDLIPQDLDIDDPAVEYFFDRAYISLLNVKEGDTISSPSYVLCTLTYYESARVKIQLTQDVVNALRVAMGAEGESGDGDEGVASDALAVSAGKGLDVTVNFSSPKGALSGTLKNIPRSPTAVVNGVGVFEAYVYIDNIPGPDSESTVNAKTILGGAVSVTIKTREVSGLIAPIGAVRNDLATGKDYVLVRKGSSNQTEKVNVQRLFASGKQVIIRAESEDDAEKIQSGTAIYYPKNEESLIASLL